MNPFVLPSGQPSGDTFPIFRDGICNLFHMMPPVIAHHVSRDLLHWEARPVAVAPGAPGEPDSENNATGCVVEHGGRFFLFYTGNQNICLAVSDDLDHWEKYPGNPVVQGDHVQYGTANFRDACVFAGPDGAWWMLFGTQTLDAPGQRAGCVGLATSADLLHWHLEPPLWAPHIGPHTDCPQLLRHLDRWYLFYLQRNTRVRVAGAPTGPFRRPPVRNLGTALANAGSRPAWDGRRWLTFPFIARLSEESDYGDWQYGGPLAIPRELVFAPDGSVGDRPAEEILAAISALPDPGDPLAGAQSVTGAWTLGERRAVSTGADGGTLLLPALPADVYLESVVILDTPDSDFHLLLRAEPSFMSGYQLALHPRAGQVSLRPISQWDVDRVLVSRTANIPVRQPLTVRVFLCGSALEVFLDDRCSLTARLYRHRAGMPGLEFRDGTGTVSDCRWRLLEE